MNARDDDDERISRRPGTRRFGISLSFCFKTISARFPSSTRSGAAVGMVSEGDLVGRDETQRDARREWWLALLAEGESLSADFLASLRHAERVASDDHVAAGRHRRRGHRYRRDRALACRPSDQARARGEERAGGRHRQPRESAARACEVKSAHHDVKSHRGRCGARSGRRAGAAQVAFRTSAP